MSHQNDSESPQPVAEDESLAGITTPDLLAFAKGYLVPVLRYTADKKGYTFDQESGMDKDDFEDWAKSRAEMAVEKWDAILEANAIAMASADPEPTIPNMDKEPVSLKPCEPPSSASHTAPCYIHGDPDWEGLKLALNEAIWTKAPPATTLEQAEEAACRAIGYLNQCFEANA